MFCEPLESRIAPASLSVVAFGHGEEVAPPIPDKVAAPGSGPAPAPGYISFTVSLDEPLTAPVDVEYFTSDGTATAGADYAAITGTLTFAPGEVSKTVVVPVFDDATAEADETLTLNLTKPNGASLANASAEAAIWDNDTLVDFAGQEISEGDNGAKTALFTFVLASPLAHPVSISYATVDGTAIAGLDYLATDGVLTFQPGETAKVVAVSILGDKLDEPAEEFSLVTGALTGAKFGGGLPMRIMDDDAKPGMSISDAVVMEGESGFVTATLVVSLEAPSAKPITVEFATGGGSATPGSDYVQSSGTLAFAPGETSKVISIVIVSDTEPEADEAFNVQITSATNAEIKDGEATVTIWSDDSNTPSPIISIADASIVEGDMGSTDAEFTITLNAPGSRTIFVSYTTVSASATEAEDFVGKTEVLSFAPGETSKKIRIAVNGDFNIEPDEMFSVALSAPVNATLGDAEGIGMIENDDMPALPALTVGDASIIEATGAAKHAVFTLTLNTTSASDVTVAYATTGGTAIAGVDFVSAIGTITFAPGERTKTILVTVIGDSIVEPDESFTLTLSNPVNATLEDAVAGGTIINDDTIQASPNGFALTPRLATWIDSDGDVVRLVSSRAILTPEMFNFDANGELALLNLATAGLAKANLNFKVKPAESGDGSVHIGAIESPGKDLGTVTVKGSLGRIVAGDAKTTTPGVSGLVVDTLGYVADKSGPASLRSDVTGSIAKLVVRKSFNGAAVYVSGTRAGGSPSTMITGDMTATPGAMDTGLHADGVIGTVRVTVSISGADGNQPVQIFAAGWAGNAIKNVIVLGGMQFAQLVAGHGATPAATTGWANIGTVSVNGALLASTISAGLAPDNGGFFGSTDYSVLPGGYGRIAKVIAGNAKTGGVINGTPDEISAVDQFGIFARHIGSVKVAGKLLPMQKYAQENYHIGTTGDVICREF